MTTKERFCLRWVEYKVMVGFCSAMTLCIMLLVLLYLPYNGGPLDRSISACGDCVLAMESQLQAKLGPTEEHIKQVLANLTSSSPPHMEEINSTTISGGPDGAPELVKEVVKVIDEWELPAIADDRPHEKLDDVETYGEPRRFKPMGNGAFLFIQFGAYRGGSNTFAIVGLGTKGLHKHGNPGFECSWVSNGDNSTVQGNTTKYYPDWGFGKQYSVIVVNCTFPSDVGVDGSGGRLEVVANHGTWDHTGLKDVHFVALTEEPKIYDGAIFGAPYKYDYLYCGSPLFGAISPQRIREWIAYHVKLFGPRSHFILYDAGGIHEEVRKILEPWIKLGFVSVTNIRQEARYDVYYFSQFLINNDCIFRAKTLSKWTFFFDVDEYVHVPEDLTLDHVMSEFQNMGRKAQQVVFKQKFMDHNHCVSNASLSSDDLLREWGFEKLVYRRTQYTKHFGFPNRKYAIQAQYALSAGVHNSGHTLLPEGMAFQKTIRYEDRKMTYYHYHETISSREELCQEFVDPALNVTNINDATHEVDNSMAVLADAVREFEFQTVGQQPFLP